MAATRRAAPFVKRKAGAVFAKRRSPPGGPASGPPTEGNRLPNFADQWKNIQNAAKNRGAIVKILPTKIEQVPKKQPPKIFPEQTQNFFKKTRGSSNGLPTTLTEKSALGL